MEKAMLTKIGIALSAIIVVSVSTMPAFSASSKARVARQAASSSRVQHHIPPPAYGVRTDGRAHSSNPTYDVYVDGLYAGSDPDPHVRTQLQMDPPWKRGK
jgi:hypothetical protein